MSWPAFLQLGIVAFVVGVSTFIGGCAGVPFDTIPSDDMSPSNTPLSEKARQDVGGAPEPSATLLPTETPTPTVSPSATSTETPTETATDTPTTTTEPTLVPTAQPTVTDVPTAASHPATAEPARSCCKMCTKGKACGDSCISRSYTCHKPPGCACNG